MILSCSYLLWILILFKYMLIVAINLLFSFIPMGMDRMHVFNPMPHPCSLLPFWCPDAKGGEESRVLGVFPFPGCCGVAVLHKPAFATLFASYLACATICYRFRNHLLFLIFCVWTSYCMLNLYVG